VLGNILGIADEDILQVAIIIGISLILLLIFLVILFLKLPNYQFMVSLPTDVR